MNGALVFQASLTVTGDALRGAAQVGQHMTSPAITINEQASVQEAADLMLKHKIRRLPVVDDLGRPVG